MPCGCGTGFRAVRVVGFGGYFPLFNLRSSVKHKKGSSMRTLLPPACGGGRQLQPRGINLPSVELGLADSSSGVGKSGVVGIAHKELFHSSSKCTVTVVENRRASVKQSCGSTVLHGFEVCNFGRTGWVTQDVSNASFSATGYGGRTQGRRPSLSDVAVTENELEEELEGEDIEEDEGIEEAEDNEDEVEDFWEDDKPADPQAGDGEDGGGMVLGDAEWGQRALSLATETLESTFSSTFALYAFKLSKDAGLIRVRLDKLTDKYGSPSLTEIEKFSSVYGKRLQEEGLAGTIPDNLALEVSSPGAERVVKVPHDLQRFKDLPMYVRYSDVGGDGEASDKDSILQVEKVEADMAVWKLANVRANREVGGRGRPLNKKQKEWRLELPFSATKLVRLYLDV